MHWPGVACRTRQGLVVLRFYVALKTGMTSHLNEAFCKVRLGKLFRCLTAGSEHIARSTGYDEFSEERSPQILDGLRTASPRFAHCSREGRIGVVSWAPEFHADEGRLTGGQ
jgi:hypothetical protein